MNLKNACFLLLFNIIAFDLYAQETITLGTTHWCPYTCDYQGNENGVVGDILAKALSQHNIKLNIEHYPWSRAITLANENKIDGLLTATPEESEDLIFSTSPLGNYQMCFYTRAESKWQYTQELDFNNNKLGIIQNYGYGEPLDSYLKTKKYKNLYEISGSNSISRLIKLLANNRVDIIIEDRLVFNWTRSKNPALKQLPIREAGCLPKHLFYLALSPTEANKIRMRSLIPAIKESYQTFLDIYK